MFSFNKNKEWPRKQPLQQSPKSQTVPKPVGFPTPHGPVHLCLRGANGQGQGDQTNGAQRQEGCSKAQGVR